MDEQKTYGWDDEIQNEASFLVLEPGIYRFKITGFTRERYSGGEKIPPCNRANLEMTVYDKEGRSTTIKESLFLIERMEWKLSQFFLGLGLKKHGEKVKMQFDKILGREGMCHVIKQTYVSKNDGQERETNRIDEYLDPEKYPLPTTTSAANPNSWQGGKW